MVLCYLKASIKNVLLDSETESDGMLVLLGFIEWVIGTILVW